MLNSQDRVVPHLILASRSPRRRELLEQIGVQYQCIVADVPETREPDENPTDYVHRLAETKALAGYKVHGEMKPSCRVPVLGADTIVVCAGAVLEKPNNKAEAVAMLMAISETSHEVMTAVSVCLGDTIETVINTTRVYCRNITLREAQAYWQTGEPADKAGGYGIQGLAAIFIERIDGSYSGVMGLPLFETAALLNRFNVPIGQATNQ